MFVKAVEIASAFTRPIHFISRTYGSTVVQPGAATLFFVNRDGWALTCGHVARELLAATQLSARRKQFLDELAGAPEGQMDGQFREELERKHGLSASTSYELHARFVDCLEGDLHAEIKLHSTHDLALIHFMGFSRLLCTSFPVFADSRTPLSPGKFLCRLGFPFVEFSNFAYDEGDDRIQWTSAGRTTTPRFPLEGMVTRLVEIDGQVAGFELSTPGLRGQSGGPAFDSQGRVWGMQCSTLHLDLNFDVDQEVIRNGQKTRARDSAFLHVGRCLHVEVLKAFMRQQGVRFQEAAPSE